MSRFYVGQRVRIKYSNGWPELAGQEGRVVGPVLDGGLRGDSDWFVAPDCWGTHIAPRQCAIGGAAFGPNSRQLEPIQPEGHQPSEFTTLTELLDSLRIAA